jgi:hypothetical protein
MVCELDWTGFNQLVTWNSDEEQKYSVQVGLILACSVWKVEFWFSSMVSNTPDSMSHL